MKSQSRSTKIHFEMASITEKELLLQIFDHVVPFADSIGMNEQVSSLSAITYKEIALLTGSFPHFDLYADVSSVIEVIS